MSERDGAPHDDVLQAIDEVRHTMTDFEQSSDGPAVAQVVPLGGVALQGGSVGHPLRKPVAPRWTQGLARKMGDDYLRRADDYLIHLRTEERAAFPGGELSEERARQASRLIAVTAGYAASLGVDISGLLFPATSDNICFYSKEEYAALQKKIPWLVHSQAFNGPYTHFIGVNAASGTAGDLVSAQHEIVHRLGVKQYVLVHNPNGTIGIRCWRSGWRIGKHFGMLDEAVVNDITDDIKQQSWPAAEELAPYADAMNPDIAENVRMRKDKHIAGVILRALHRTMCDRASDVSGEDVRNELRAAHFTGDIAPLHTLSKVFGNRAVIMLAKYDVFSPSLEGIMDIAREMGTYHAFMKDMRSYKDLATPAQRLLRIFN